MTQVAKKTATKKTAAKKAAFTGQVAPKVKAKAKKAVPAKNPLNKIISILKPVAILISEDSDYEDLFITAALDTAKLGLLGGLNEDLSALDVPAEPIIKSYGEIVRVLAKYDWGKKLPIISPEDMDILKVSLEILMQCGANNDTGDRTNRYKMLSYMVYTSEVIDRAKKNALLTASTFLDILTIIDKLFEAGMVVFNANDAQRSELIALRREYDKSCEAEFDFANYPMISMDLASSIMWKHAKHMIPNAVEKKVYKYFIANPRHKIIECSYPSQAREMEAMIQSFVTELIGIFATKELTSEYDKEKAFKTLASEKALTPIE